MLHAFSAFRVHNFMYQLGTRLPDPPSAQSRLPSKESQNTSCSLPSEEHGSNSPSSARSTSHCCATAPSPWLAAHLGSGGFPPFEG